jgi:membrane associated rhomboid family serine protease
VPRTGVSWQDHLFGGLGGILAARVMTTGVKGVVKTAAKLGPG